VAWQAGILGQAPECVDHTVVAMDLDGAGDDAVLTIVMRDVGPSLVPPGDCPPGSTPDSSPTWPPGPRVLGLGSELSWWEAQAAGAAARQRIAIR
jgi:hypothetical protein